VSTFTKGQAVRVTPKVKQATEKAIRSSARKLFIRKGLDATSTREIARSAGIAIGTLFNYFSSKEALAVAIAADAFEVGREKAQERLLETAARNAALEEDLFTLIACDIRALEPIRRFVGEVLETGLSPFGAGVNSSESADIRAGRLEDAAAALARHSLDDAATAPLMHLYWSLYLGVLSFWSADPSPGQEDTWALLDRGVRMFAGSLRPAASPGDASPPLATTKTAPSTDPVDASEIHP
jgi:AcrR family transcriptional regulator